MEEKRQAMLRRKNAMWTERSSWDSHWREIASCQMPRAGRFLCRPHFRHGPFAESAVLDVPFPVRRQFGVRPIIQRNDQDRSVIHRCPRQRIIDQRKLSDKTTAAAIYDNCAIILCCFCQHAAQVSL